MYDAHEMGRRYFFCNAMDGPPQYGKLPCIYRNDFIARHGIAVNLKGLCIKIRLVVGWDNNCVIDNQ